MLSSVAIAVALFMATGIAGQSRQPSLQGVWQTVEFKISGPAPRTITIPEPRANLMILTARHYARVEVQTEAPRAAIADVAKATADELRAVWGPFVGEAGTWDVKGDVITMRPIAAKNPAAMVPGAFIDYTFQVVGNTLTVTQVRNQNGPFPNPFTIKAVRVE
jgi:hypothetical protein